MAGCLACGSAAEGANQKVLPDRLETAGKERAWPGRRLDHITQDHIASLVVGSSPANTNNALRTLRRMLKKAHEWEMIRSVPRREAR